ncbi:MAG: response regulator [Candidatus Marinimicrobia bacterium]|nr:response regulator [Candidatus Neomarinimicrobiota bacterium]
MSAPESKKRHLPSIKKLESFRKTSLDCAQSINGNLTSILGAAEELWGHVDKKDFFATEQIDTIIRTVDKIKSSTRRIEIENAKLSDKKQSSAGEKTRLQQEGTKILLAEDDEDNRNVLRIMLESMGYNVTLAKDGREAWTKFESSKFSAVISDIQMPKIGGIELLKKIHKKNSDIPVLLITGFDRKEPVEMAREENNIFFLKKPFRKQKLKSVLEECLD